MSLHLEQKSRLKNRATSNAADCVPWLMTWVKGLSWGWTINLFSPHLRTLHSITISFLIVPICQNASQSGKLRMCHHQTISDNRESPGVCQNYFHQFICVDSACMSQPFSSFSSLRTILSEAMALASICQRKKKSAAQSCKWTAYGLACFWSFPKKFLGNWMSMRLMIPSCPTFILWNRFL